MKTLLKKVQDSIIENSLLLKNDNCLVACSGGIDSMVLLEIMQRIWQKEWGKLAVAHYNHHLRDRASDEDALFVVDYCKKNNLECFMGQGKVLDIAKEKKRSIEDMAREMRYAFLQNVAKKIGGALIAVAHHANDQAETFLLQLLRGAGSNGLLAMKKKNGNIIRPLLDFSKKEIELFAKKENIDFCIDATNFNDNLLRNKIRLKLLPLLIKEYNAKTVEILNRTANILLAENDFVLQSTKNIYEKCVTKQNNIFMIDVDKLLKFPIALQRGVIREVFKKVTGFLKDLSFLHVETILKGLKNSKKEAIWTMPHNFWAYKHEILTQGISNRYLYCGDKLKVEAFKDTLKKQTKVLLLEKFSFEKEKNFFEQLGVFVEIKIIEKNIWEGFINHNKKDKHLNDVFFDYDELYKIKETLVWRNREKGDKILLKDIDGYKKIKKFFIDEKIARNLRDEIILLANADEILWICGYRRCNKYLVNESSKKVLYLHFEVL